MSKSRKRPTANRPYRLTVASPMPRPIPMSCPVIEIAIEIGELLVARDLFGRVAGGNAKLAADLETLPTTVDTMLNSLEPTALARAPQDGLGAMFQLYLVAFELQRILENDEDVVPPAARRRLEAVRLAIISSATYIAQSTAANVVPPDYHRALDYYSTPENRALRQALNFVRKHQSTAARELAAKRL